MQAHLLKYLLRLLGGSPVKVRPHAVVIPLLCQLPGLIQGQHLATWPRHALAPGIHLIFRPEEQYSRSGEDEIVVPLMKWQREVDHLAMPMDTVLDDVQRDAGMLRISHARLDLGVRVQGGRNA